ncbi:MAG: T9SS type A sorting domain-containing protein, partial [Ignavibacteriaceae bacterium]
SLVSTANNILFAGGDYGIYKSIDNGDTWTEAGLSGLTIFDIDIDNSGVIYANVFYRGQGIYRSQDQGANWEQLNIGLNDQLTTAVAVDFQGNIYVGTSEGGVFQKATGQPSFTQINLHQAMSNVLSIYVAQDNSLYICSELGGLFKRNVLSLEWKQLNSGLPMEHAIPLGFDSDDNFYMGNFYSGFYRSTDTGNSWFPIAPYLGGSHLFTFLANDNQLFLGTTIEIAFVGVLFRSTDQGENWDLFQEGIPSIDPNWPYIQVVLGMDVNSNGDLFAALNTSGIYRRLVTDDRWYFVNSDIPDTNVFSVCVNSNDIVFAGYINGFIYKSDDNGENWVESLSGVQDYTVEYLKSVDNYVFTILHNWNYPYQDSSLGLYSYDNGSTWLDLNVSGLGSHVNSINFYGGNIIVVGTDSNGVFVSYDFGQNWISASSGLSDNVIKDIVLHPDGHLLCGTEKEGIFIADLNPSNITDINNTSKTFSLYQNYPNPFNPTTKIKYSVPKSEIVQIKVYDILGRELQTILNDFKQAGAYEIKFDATGLPSGVYFYQIKAGNFVETKKMVLLR